LPLGGGDELVSRPDGITHEERTTTTLLVGPRAGGDFLKERDVTCL